MKIQGIETRNGYIWVVAETSTGRIAFRGNTKQRAEEALAWNGDGFVIYKVYG